MTIADVQDATGEKVAANLNAKGYHVSFVHCDTTDWESSVAAFKHAASFGPRETLDVAILNAGIEGDKGSITDQVLAAVEPSLESAVVPARPPRKGTAVNFLGVYDGCWLALHYMRLAAKTGPANASKSLIMTGSLASYADMPTNTDYNAAKCKHYLLSQITRTLTQNESWCSWYRPRPPTHNRQHECPRQPNCSLLDQHTARSVRHANN